MINPIRLSQGHLNCLENCPLQFQRIYLENLADPISCQQLEKLRWGSQFHLLMQQWCLGLPVEELLNSNKEFKSYFEEISSAINLSDRNIITQEAEHCRTMKVKDFFLTVIYDLLITFPDKAEILDWKTYPKPDTTDTLAKNWQTRLYLYVLAETSEYLPSQISMTYWFIGDNNKPAPSTFNYNSVAHEETHKDLTKLLSDLEQWLEDYENLDIDFPHKEDCVNNCLYYKKQQEQERKTQEPDLTVALEEVAEIAL